jgi:hypothetical protein
MSRKSDYQTLSAYCRADGDPEGPVDHYERETWCESCGRYSKPGTPHTDACFERRQGLR